MAADRPGAGCAVGTRILVTQAAPEQSKPAASTRNNPFWPIWQELHPEPDVTNLEEQYHTPASRSTVESRFPEESELDRTHTLIDHRANRLLPAGWPSSSRTTFLAWTLNSSPVSVSFPPARSGVNSMGDPRHGPRHKMRMPRRLHHGFGRGPLPGFRYRQVKLTAAEGKPSCRPFSSCWPILNSLRTPCKDAFGSPDCQTTDRE